MFDCETDELFVCAFGADEERFVFDLLSLGSGERGLCGRILRRFGKCEMGGVTYLIENNNNE